MIVSICWEKSSKADQQAWQEAKVSLCIRVVTREEEVIRNQHVSCHLSAQESGSHRVGRNKKRYVAAWHIPGESLKALTPSMEKTQLRRWGTPGSWSLQATDQSSAEEAWSTPLSHEQHVDSSRLPNWEQGSQGNSPRLDTPHRAERVCVCTCRGNSCAFRKSVRRIPP